MKVLVNIPDVKIGMKLYEDENLKAMDILVGLIYLKLDLFVWEGNHVLFVFGYNTTQCGIRVHSHSQFLLMN